MANEIRIVRYDPSLKREWNLFVSKSRQQNLIFNRDYIDYHGERFNDCSLLAFKGNRIAGILPCEVSGTKATSHRGLTFGGWLTPENHLDVGRMEEIMAESINFFRKIGVKELIYRPVTDIYLTRAADEDKWVITRMGGIITDVTLYWVGEVRNFAEKLRPTARHELRQHGRHKTPIRESDDWEKFQELLERRLKEKYNAAPVHSFEEIMRLKNLFPDKILLYCAYSDTGELSAGSIVYKSRNVLKTQYIATTAKGREKGVLPSLLLKICADNPNSTFLDMGSSMEDKDINRGLELNKYLLGMRPLAGYTINIAL